MRRKNIARPKCVSMLSIGDNDSRITVTIRPSQMWKVFKYDDGHMVLANGKTQLVMSDNYFAEKFQMEGEANGQT